MSPRRPRRRSAGVAGALALAVVVSVGAGARAAASPATRRHAAHARVSAARAPAAPADPPAGPAAAPSGGGQNGAYSDPFSALGARSPFCSRPVGATALANCRASGSVAHPYPLSSYGIDNQVSFGVTNISDNLLGALQDVAAFGWLVLVYLVKGVLLLLEWGFSLDLLNRAMSAVRDALDTLHRSVLGEPWFVAAIAVAGLWGIWRGLVQRRTIQTLGGLAATVVLMVAALVVISNPVATVGGTSKLADDASLGVAVATSGGTLRAPAQSFATALEGLFTTTVLKPWAALEFGDVRWALGPARRGSPVTNADVWLTFAAGSRQRTDLYELQKGQSLGGSGIFDDLTSNPTAAVLGPLGQSLGLVQGIHDINQANAAELSDALKAYVHKDPSKVSIQEAGGTFPRLALLGLIAVGLVGAVLLFLYVGVKLLLASIMSLLLVLLAPAMLLVPAFGDSGRATTVAWGKRLAGNLFAKLIYALLLAILLTASAAIESLDIGWVGSWLLLIAFWWGVLLKRRELIGFISVGHAEPARGGSLITRAYHATRLAEAAWRPVARVDAALRHAREGELERPWRPDATAQEEADRLAEDDAAQATHAHELDRDRSADEIRGRLARRWRLERELDEVEASSGQAGEDAAATAPIDSAAGRAGVPPRRSPNADSPSAVDTALRARRERLIEALHSETRRSPGPTEIGRPDPSLSNAAPAGLSPPPGDDPGFDRWCERRLADVENRALELDDPRHMRAAGIDPAAYDAASEERKAELREHLRMVVERDRCELAELAAAPRPAAAEPESTAGEIDHRAHLRVGDGAARASEGMPDRSRRHVR